MKINEYINELMPTLAGYLMLNKHFPHHSSISTPYPPSELSEEELEALKEQLRNYMPLDSIITDLWDWDIRFENDLEDDWYFAAAFGTTSSLEAISEYLAEYFLEKADEYKRDYDQHEDDDTFSSFVTAEAQKFIAGWRNNIIKGVS